jgi:hypothetical protein
MTNDFNHPPEVGGYKIKAGLKPAEWVARCVFQKLKGCSPEQPNLSEIFSRAGARPSSQSQNGSG